MTQDERRLLRQLVTAVLIKLVVLVVLWWAFVRDARVSVDTDDVAAQLGGQPISQGASK
jgi:multidrug resistance efflux pump